MRAINWTPIHGMPWSASAVDAAGNTYKVLRHESKNYELIIHLPNSESDLRLASDRRQDLRMLAEYIIRNFGNALPAPAVESSPNKEFDYPNYKLQQLVKLIRYFHVLQNTSIGVLATMVDNIDGMLLIQMEENLRVFCEPGETLPIAAIIPRSRANGNGKAHH